MRSWPPVTSSAARRAFAAAVALGMALTGCASGPRPRRERMLRFSGAGWRVRSTAGEPQGPGPNVFADNPGSVGVDERGRLHLKIVSDGPRALCAEVVSRRSFGRGTYRFVVETPPRLLPPGVVLGLFTYEPGPVPAHREIDVELSRSAPDRAGVQFVVQPGAGPGTFHRVRLPEDAAQTVYSFRLLPGRVEFTAGSPERPDEFARWVSSGSPDGGPANVRMNLWLTGRGQTPGGVPVEAVISRFEFVPSD